jgi:hypothetical protein
MSGISQSVKHTHWILSFFSHERRNAGSQVGHSPKYVENITIFFIVKPFEDRKSGRTSLASTPRRVPW